MIVVSGVFSSSRSQYGSQLTGMEMIDSEPTNPGCKALVQPKFVPPIHRDKVAEPLMGKFYTEC
jgi:hypothetical protein